MEQPVICPWCQTEIVWDEEVGPEPYCPHCDNELDGYRTISFSVDQDDEETDDGLQQEADDESALAELDPDGYRHTNPGMLALQEKLESVLDLQEEVPECPVCREYMLELGKQTIAEDNWEPTVHEALGSPLAKAPLRMVWYVCPSCYHMQNRLGLNDREKLMKRLSGEA